MPYWMVAASQIFFSVAVACYAVAQMRYTRVERKLLELLMLRIKQQQERLEALEGRPASRSTWIASQN